MMRVFARLTVAALLAAPLLFGSAAKADLILTYTGNGPEQGLAMHATWTPYDPMPAGVFNFNVDSGGPENGFGPTIRAFCAEIFTDVLHGGLPSSYSVVPVANLADLQSPPRGLPADPINKANYLTELFGRYYASTNTNEGAAAFQYAVWEILYDSVTGLDVASGNIRFDPTTTAGSQTLSSSTATTAAGWLSTLSGDTTQFTNNPTYAGYEVVGLSSVDYQDQITIRTPPGVPAPPAFLLGVLGFAAVAGRTWLKRRSAVVA